MNLKFNKTLGYDGMLVEICVFFYDIIDILLNCYQYSFEQCLMSSSQRDVITRPTLLPKKDKDPFLVSNYRPIPLLNTDYKMIAKVMARRLSLCLHRIIHGAQTGFMKGRNIGSNNRAIPDRVGNFPGIPA